MYSTKREYANRKEQAVKASKDHKKSMVGMKTIMVPHPTVPKTWIEKIVPDEEE